MSSTELMDVSRRDAGIVSNEANRFSLADIRQRVNLVQEVMRGIMKRDTHYGTIPGTPKPTLYKPGAEVLCVTFRVAQEYKIDDLSTDTIARFRVTCLGRHQTTGITLGEGVGECSSGEEKYKWRGAVCAEEFQLTPENMRRVKFYKNGGKATQVRTEAADLSNTVLKMACKRAMIAMTLNVTAASDIFTQDIEDLPEELRPRDEETVRDVKSPAQIGAAAMPVVSDAADRTEERAMLIADLEATAKEEGLPGLEQRWKTVLTIQRRKLVGAVEWARIKALATKPEPVGEAEAEFVAEIDAAAAS